jgi:hypothetical protein
METTPINLQWFEKSIGSLYLDYKKHAPPCPAVDRESTTLRAPQQLRDTQTAPWKRRKGVTKRRERT